MILRGRDIAISRYARQSDAARAGRPTRPRSRKNRRVSDVQGHSRTGWRGRTGNGGYMHRGLGTRSEKCLEPGAKANRTVKGRRENGPSALQPISKVASPTDLGQTASNWRRSKSEHYFLVPEGSATSVGIERQQRAGKEE